MPPAATITTRTCPYHSHGLHLNVTTNAPTHTPHLCGNQQQVVDIFDALPDNSVDIVYDNYGADGTADKAMPKIRSGGVYLLMPHGECFVSKSQKPPCLSAHPKPGVSQVNYDTGSDDKYVHPQLFVNNDVVVTIALCCAHSHRYCECKKKQKKLQLRNKSDACASSRVSRSSSINCTFVRLA
jgi:hypothetical protein